MQKTYKTTRRAYNEIKKIEVCDFTLREVFRFIVTLHQTQMLRSYHYQNLPKHVNIRH